MSAFGSNFMDRRNFIATGLAVAGCTTVTNAGPIPEMEYEVFRAVLANDRSLWPGFALAVQTTTLALERTPEGVLSLGTDGSLTYVLDNQLVDVGPELAREIFSANSSVWTLNRHSFQPYIKDFFSPAEFKLIRDYSYQERDSELNTSLPSRLNNFQQQKFLIKKFSRIAFSFDRTKAIGVTEGFAGADWEFAELVILEKASNEWVVSETVALWVT